MREHWTSAVRPSVFPLFVINPRHESEIGRQFLLARKILDVADHRQQDRSTERSMGSSSSSRNDRSFEIALVSPRFVA